jgi:hypothetical protein
LSEYVIPSTASAPDLDDLPLDPLLTLALLGPAMRVESTTNTLTRYVYETTNLVVAIGRDSMLAVAPPRELAAERYVTRGFVASLGPASAFGETPFAARIALARQL